MSDADATPALPDDVAGLKAMVLAQTAELVEIRVLRQAQEAELAAARAGLIEQRFEIEALKSRLARLQRMTFGRSSEKLRDQVGRRVPPRLIEQDDGVRAWYDSLRDFRQMQHHRGAVAPRQHEPGTDATFWADGAEDIG